MGKVYDIRYFIANQNFKQLNRDFNSYYKKSFQNSYKNKAKIEKVDNNQR